MNHKWTITAFPIFFLILFQLPLFAAETTAPPSADKGFVTDGHVTHDIGNLHNHVTNWGFIGSAPSVPSSFGHAPSGRWPGATGQDYLWAAGLWVGGKILGEPLVSTGAWNTVWFPSEAPEDTIYAAGSGLPAANRFPWNDPDDDGDGLEDEDPPNGRDDDGDGLVDEDFAGIGHQAFRREYRDDTLEAQQLYPDHTPLGLSVVEESFQWDLPLLNNTIGYQFTITNENVIAIQDVHVAMFSDFDVAEAMDDRTAYWSGEVEASDGQLYPVSVAYIYDDATYQPVPGMEGWVLLGHTTDPEGAAAPAEPAVLCYRDWSGNAAYPQGDPTNDAERYEVLSTPHIDGNSIHANDWRSLMGSGPFTTLEPGESIQYQVGLVAGENLEAMLASAAELVACYRGRDFEDLGQMVHVPWIPLSENIVAVEEELEGEPDPLPAPTLQLSAHPNPFNPWCEIRFSLAEEGPARVDILDLRGNLVRRLFSGQAGAGANARVWDGRDEQGRAAASGIYRVQVSGESRVLETRITLVR